MPDGCNALSARFAQMGQNTSLMSETAVQPQGFDYAAAGIGASVGFVAAYAALRFLKRKNHDDFERV